MTYLHEIEDALGEIRSQHRYRELTGEEPRYVADFSTNDYLALATDSSMIEAMRHVKRVGSGGARLLGGRHREHWLLEQDIARWLGRERALLFSSGYMAALGTIQVLAQFADTIYSDALNHACLIDGIRAAKVSRVVYPHGKLNDREERPGRSLIVTESLFGMDGDTIDLHALVADLAPDDMLLVDEAHALGVLGPEGGGLAHGIDDQRVIVLGTLGKAIGCAGGFIAGPAPACRSAYQRSAHVYLRYGSSARHCIRRESRHHARAKRRRSPYTAFCQDRSFTLWDARDRICRVRCALADRSGCAWSGTASARDDGSVFRTRYLCARRPSADGSRRDVTAEDFDAIGSY